MKYLIIFVVIIALLVIYTYFSTLNGKKKAPQRLINAKKKFADGDSNAALKELGAAFVLPMSDKISPEYKVHLLAVLDLLKQILTGMNVSSDKMITPLYTKLTSTSGEVQIDEPQYKALKSFFEKTESDEELVLFLKQAVMSGEINVLNTENSSSNTSGDSRNEEVTDIINKAGKFMLKGAPTQAIDIYAEALTKKWEKKDEAFLHDQLGSCYLMNKDLVKAEECYKKSIEVDAAFFNLWNYCDFLVYNKRKNDAEPNLQTLSKYISSKSDQKEYDTVFQKWSKL